MVEGMTGTLPRFTGDGLLPSGDHPLTLNELRESLLVIGPEDKGRYPNWDIAWRCELVDRLGLLCGQLWRVGATDIFIDGSFTEDKEHPNDIDGYFVCELEHLASARLQRELNLIDEHKVWTWDPASRRPYRGYEKKQLPMWHRYRVELYPHYGQMSGIHDEHGNELTFPSAFRRSRRDNKPRGIVRIVNGEST